MSRTLYGPIAAPAPQHHGRRKFLAGAATAVLAPAVRPAAAQSYPTRGITIVVPASPGGAIDITARLLGARMTQTWGQPVNVDNRGGATGMIGTEIVAKAPPDGHTLALVASSHAINPSMFRKLPFDTIKSFEPVVLTHIVPLVLIINPALPAKTLPELIAYGKANPGKLTFASSGNGGAPHMSGELFKSMTGIDMIHVPYKGSTAAHPDLIAGRTSLMFDTVAAAAPQIRGNTLRVLAVTTAKRSSVFPDLPTMIESGLPGYDTSTWGGLLAPAGTPKDVVAKINGEAVKALATAEIRERLAGAGIEPAGGSPEDFGRFIRSEIERWAKVAKDAGIQPE